MANSPSPTDFILVLKHLQTVNLVVSSNDSSKVLILNILEQLYPHLSAKDCRNLFGTIVWFVIIGMSIAEVIFTVRVWAAWGKNKWSTFFLPIIYLACWMPGYVVLGRAVITAQFNVQDLVLRGCLQTGGLDNLGISIAWAILFVYDIEFLNPN
ncbi:hypothetical protein BDQ17DRAFT_1336232 [Cyathus striatus]|nr:hypothetical protein BDQ17DRAFT_1336232 [Cyathus striatus]